MDELQQWLDEGYGRSYGTAWLILNDPVGAEEAVQEAYLRAWRFRRSLPVGESRRPWVYRALVTACASRLRGGRERAWTAAPRPSDSDDAGSAMQPALRAGTAADASSTVDALAGLPEHLRVAVVLRDWTGLSEREIATAIRCRPHTVSSRLLEGRQRLSQNPSLHPLVTQEA